MVRRFIATALAGVACVAVPRSEAAGIQVVRHIPGCECMMLNQTPDQAIDPTFKVPVFASPNANRAPVGNAMPVVAVKQPVTPVNGFLQALFPNGTTVWIQASAIKPYHSLGAPNTRCTPAMMSTGAVGFDYTTGTR